MNTLIFDTSLVITKLARALAYKEAKKDKSKVDFYINLFKRQITTSIKLTEHFKQRVEQRFEALEADLLSCAISRSIRNTSPLSMGAEYHIAKTQKYLDNESNIVVLERQGEFGAVLVTTYKRGEENLLSDEELSDLRKRGVL
ncbi:hypothetical protein CUPS4244_02735 [Campylobacter upsaliensis]|uniref:hypothetical protein n=1 Tax=Campylobacter upsaliensis TaxID=28080 RepID=UPI00214A5754|nr:hypothetical protein [Campylobacter upsaliensis]MCR2104013.1 hypothetical protein [Campylobacter upsaliensis]